VKRRDCTSINRSSKYQIQLTQCLAEFMAEFMADFMGDVVPDFMARNMACPVVNCGLRTRAARPYDEGSQLAIRLRHSPGIAERIPHLK